MSHSDDIDRFVSRAGAKLAHALREFKIDPAGWRCADVGSNAGGFVDCLLQCGAARVIAIERGYGVLHHKLRSDARVAVMERTDALHVHLPEPVHLVTIDAGWTRQRLILPVAASWLAEGGAIVTLIKPHYEAPADCLKAGVLQDEHMGDVLSAVRAEIGGAKLEIVAETESPIRGQGGNREFLWHLMPRQARP